jgi:hypothetical protein
MRNLPDTTPEQSDVPASSIDRNSKNKQLLKELLGKLSTLEQLEEMGRQLTLLHWHFLLDVADNDQPLLAQLPALLVGLTPQNFRELLETIEPPQLKLLEQFSGTEPLQHQLTLFTHFLEELLTLVSRRQEKLAAAIDQLESSLITHRDFATLVDLIDHLRYDCEQWKPSIGKALALAWRSNQQQLVESLSALQERHSHLLTVHIGKMDAAHEHSSGLYLLLEEHLWAVFNEQDSQNHWESLKDADSPLEALAKFGLWYPKDYWEVGLLPQLGSGPEAEALFVKAAPQAWAHYTSMAVHNLACLGLCDIKAFKSHQIFSRAMLAEYATRFQHLISSS